MTVLRPLLSTRRRTKRTGRATLLEKEHALLAQVEKTFQYYRLNVTAVDGSVRVDVQELRFIIVEIPAADVNLVSQPFPAQASYDTARLTVVATHVDAGTITPNTDLLARVSRDDGTTSVDATLVAVAKPDGQQALRRPTTSTCPALLRATRCATIEDRQRRQHRTAGRCPAMGLSTICPVTITHNKPVPSSMAEARQFAFRAAMAAGNAITARVTGLYSDAERLSWGKQESEAKRVDAGETWTIQRCS